MRFETDQDMMPVGRLAHSATDRSGFRRRGRAATVSGLAILLLACGCTSTDPAEERLLAAEAANSRTGLEGYAGPLDGEFDDRLELLLADGVDEAEAVEIALHRNPSVQAAFARIGQAKAGLVQARLLPNPTINASVLYPTIPGPEKKTFSAILPLAGIWTMFSRGDSAEAVLESTVLDAARITVDIAGQTRVAFCRAQGWMRAGEAARKLRDAADHGVRLAEARARAGDLSPLEIESARTPVIDAETLVLDADRELRLAKLEFAHWIGLSADPRALDLRPRDRAQRGDLPDSFDLLSLAHAHRLDARIAELRVSAAEAEVDLQESRRLKSLSAGFSWERLLQTMRGFTFSLELPLFDQNQAQIALASAQADEARRKQMFVEQLIEFEVLSARERAAAAAEKERHLRDVALPHADALVAGAMRRLDAGDDVLDLWLRSEQARLERQREYAQAFVDLEIAEAELARTLGTSFDSPTSVPDSNPPSQDSQPEQRP